MAGNSISNKTTEKQYINKEHDVLNIKDSFKASEYIDNYMGDISDFVSQDSKLKNKYNRYLDKARFQCDSFYNKYNKAKQLCSIYTKVSIVTSVLLLTMIMPSSFNSLLGKSGDLFFLDSVIYNIIKIAVVIIFSIVSNLNLFTRPGNVKDIMRRKLIQLNSLMENTSNELILLSRDADEAKILLIIDNAFKKLNDIGYDGIDNDVG
ncbi:hypothetical protein LY28_02510 [Ruminiclostridium sufflavum DSM 19573]|uniref:SMODS and SLOG-associating 2TM effector domain-containing protein n=1 Tax=Ruminiclostridium sufflavum DSM 19573 TaxID=1121337 RepID=A0A318Y4D7_9FIRM|nr:hypothetical protein [Ruminiclostridium sufflavum]PYG86891.1 hypothetical protein LY28_02510 [Ruminiclostridium sufflavum DSM 19573]